MQRDGARARARACPRRRSDLRRVRPSALFHRPLGFLLLEQLVLNFRVSLLRGLLRSWGADRTHVSQYTTKTAWPRDTKRAQPAPARDMRDSLFILQGMRGIPF